MEDEKFIQDVISLLEQAYDEGDWEKVIESVGLLKNNSDDGFDFFLDD
jgi:hypothetical protein